MKRANKTKTEHATDRPSGKTERPLIASVGRQTDAIQSPISGKALNYRLAEPALFVTVLDLQGGPFLLQIGPKSRKIVQNSSTLVEPPLLPSSTSPSNFPPSSSYPLSKPTPFQSQPRKNTRVETSTRAHCAHSAPPPQGPPLKNKTENERRCRTTTRPKLARPTAIMGITRAATPSPPVFPCCALPWRAQLPLYWGLSLRESSTAQATGTSHVPGATAGSKTLNLN